MMGLIETRIPTDSLLYPKYTECDYTDRYECVLTDRQNKLDILDVGRCFAKPGPEFFEVLLAIRNKMVSVFGLKTPNVVRCKNSQENYKWEKGEKAGLFNVYEKTANEIILGEDDKHLNFRVSLLLVSDKNNPLEKILTVTTIVEFNNRLGNLYFFVVKPFHKMIVPIFLKKNLKIEGVSLKNIAARK